ncbi:MAG: polyprenyl synthetase family protein [Acidimicrobiales bacterium]
MAPPNPLLDLPGMAQLRERITERLLAAVETSDPQLTAMTSHLVMAGGKRLRPIICVVTWLACQGRDDGAAAALDRVSDEAVSGGVAVEMVHVGSLHHDDVIDEAITRHNVESVNARWGNLRAIISGDFLLARASELAAGLGTDVARLLARTIADLCEGEVRELHFAYQVTRTEPDYYAAIKGKTGALYAAACRIGGMVARAPADQVEALATFGQLYGMAFQVVDDVLDVVSTDVELGKPVGHDIAEGVYTLPVLRALGSPDVGAELRSLLGGPLDADTRARALHLVRRSDGVAQAVAVAEGFADEAVAVLDAVPPGPAVDALAGAVRHLVAGVAPAGAPSVSA